MYKRNFKSVYCQACVKYSIWMQSSLVPMFSTIHIWVLECTTCVNGHYILVIDINICNRLHIQQQQEKRNWILLDFMRFLHTAIFYLNPRSRTCVHFDFSSSWKYTQWENDTWLSHNLTCGTFLQMKIWKFPKYIEIVQSGTLL